MKIEKKIKSSLFSLFEFLENFNNQIICDIEDVYKIFYEINPKDYNITKPKILNLELEKAEANNNLTKDYFSNKVSEVIESLNDNIYLQIKKIHFEIEEFKNYYFKLNEENNENICKE